VYKVLLPADEAPQVRPRGYDSFTHFMGVGEDSGSRHKENMQSNIVWENS
jgi:hypothetical protein